MQASKVLLNIFTGNTGNKVPLSPDGRESEGEDTGKGDSFIISRALF